MTQQNRPAEPSPTDPDAIKADIEATREQLGRTVDELAHRLDVPARAKESLARTTAQTKANALEGVARTKDTAVETYRESPPAVLGGAGALVASVVGLVLWRRRRARRAPAAARRRATASAKASAEAGAKAATRSTRKATKAASRAGGRTARSVRR